MTSCSWSPFGHGFPKLSPSQQNELALLDLRQFPTPWSAADWEGVWQNDEYYVGVAGHVGDRLIGFSLAHGDFSSGGAQLAKILVVQALRGRGHGAQLMQETLSVLQQKGAHQLRLEVASTNRPAIGLYRRFGLKPIAERPRFYQNNERATLMTRSNY